MTLSKPSHRANLSADSHNGTQEQAALYHRDTIFIQEIRLISVPFIYVLRHISDIAGGLVQEEGHALAAEVFADDVELDCVFVDHVGDSADEQKSVKKLSNVQKGKTHPQPSSTTWDQP
jgi:hypothetical protein